MTDRHESLRKVDRELRDLAGNTQYLGPWPTPSELRHRTVHLRHQRLGLAGLGVVILAAVVVLTSTSVGGDKGKVSPIATSHTTVAHLGAATELISAVDRGGIDSKSSETVVAQAEQGFSISLLKQLVAASPDSNQLVSPFSLAEALAMTQLAARGQTAQQIESALQLAGIPQPEQEAGWAALGQDLAIAAQADHISLNSANSIWTQNGFPVNPEFLGDLKKEFGAGVWQANFDGNPDAALGAVNEWVSKETDGQIPSLLQPGDTPSSTAFVILNAVLFKAQWEDEFFPESGTFHTASGPEQASFLSNGDPTELKASSGSGIDAVEVPYWKGTLGSAGRYAALLVMPTKGSLSQLVAGLDTKRFQTIVDGLKGQSVSLQIPASHIGTTLQLQSPLEAMGIKDAFTPAANFAGFSNVATQLSEVKQKATLRVNKWGTVASAATAVVGIASSAEVGELSLIFDHPYLFLIRDTKTGAILFESAVTDPLSGS